MQHKVKVTVIDKKLYPELQREYCMDPASGACPVYNVGDEYVFSRYSSKDDFWHIGLDTLSNRADPDGVAGGKKFPHCSEAWDAIARYIYTGLQGGSIMRGWMKDPRQMIACCSDGTRPVIFKIERLDYYAVHFSSPLSDTDFGCVKTAIESVPGVTGVRREEDFVEVYVDAAPPAELDIRSAVGDLCGIRRID